MTRRTFCVAAVLSTVPASAVAQEAERLPPDPATAAAALADIRRVDGPDRRKAEHVLTQRFEARSRAELDAFADQLVEIALADGFRTLTRRSSAALSALLRSSGADERYNEVAYEGVFDALLRVWEAEARTAPAGERWDRLTALVGLYSLEPEGRGRDLLYAEIAAAEMPRQGSFASDTPWCRLATTVYFHHGHLAPENFSREARHEWALRGIEQELPGSSEPFARFCGITAHGIWVPQ